MTLYAFKNGDPIEERLMNSIFTAQSSTLIFDGDQAAVKTGSGAVENNLSLASYAVRFVLTGQTSIGRIELDLKKYGAGADMTVEIRDASFNPNGSSEGVLLKSVTFPAKIFGSGYISLPIDLSGLTAGAQYWLVMKKAGDSINHIRWVGETTQDVSYPAYSRSGVTGGWSIGNALHVKVFAKTPGTYLLKHGIYGENGKTIIEYRADGLVNYIWRWLPAADKTWKIVEKMTPVYDINGVATDWGIA
ncbi:hypothetical protein DFP93_102113 [Aneurinibacillus soli]|uniref:Uncharacterized protein n=1 Tax=Aneurinibacillus soli TaxID=1500254 RepID=A0A0U5BBS0_9BACL|nr:choice-of-anchor R domain-containing protein [Aneurinibacillus soli]PYE63429.1 hypothetical protein DFP93_102113 [Aneurinibacillus soli]BAU27639.1 hypothetical protein CB4_01813 [Aneurinibacillus soli]